MKSTGVVRKVDELGRIVLPVELRRGFGIEEKDSLEIYVEGDRVILKKYAPGCLFCGQAKDVKTILNKNVCQACLNHMKGAV